MRLLNATLIRNYFQRITLAGSRIMYSRYGQKIKANPRSGFQKPVDASRVVSLLMMSIPAAARLFHAANVNFYFNI